MLIEKTRTNKQIKTNHGDNFYHLKCIKCEAQFSEEETVTNCLKCDSALDVVYDYEYIKGRLNLYALKNSPISARKYLDFYPIKNLNQLVSLDEGGTQLHRARNLEKQLGMKNLYIKEEGLNPTGVFKDRGSLVELTKAKEIGATAVCCASTGNMASSVAAYAAVADLPCYVFVPEGTPIGKLAQTLSYGGRVIQVRGTYADCVRLCEEAAKKHNFYLAGDYVFRGEGQKSCSYEIVEQLFWESPDFVIVPMGCGTNISAIWKGFKEFHKLGLIKKLPRIIGVQPSNVPTIVDAFLQHKDRYIEVEKPYSVASAVGIGVPQDDIKALHALRESNGYAEKASEEEILAAQQLLARKEAIFVEPSAALPIACLKHLLKKEIINPEDTVVCVATGAGLKDPKTALLSITTPATIDPEFSEVENYLENKLYRITGTTITNKAKVLWSKKPTKEELSNFIEHEFNVTLQKNLIDLIYEEVCEFEKKGKSITKADLQNLIEESFNQLSLKEKILDVEDFKVSTSKHKMACAKTKITFMGKQVEETAEGVGTVDAIIKSLRKSIQKEDQLEMQLTDYNVEISTGEVDAVVKVTMHLKDKHDNKVIATTTSPDVVVASISAFVKGYNLLYHKHKNGKKTNNAC
jgi:threonine synthase